ncbi:MAG: hypothetical protein ACR2MO_10020 [Acidimicrobiales bacterium]
MPSRVAEFVVRRRPFGRPQRLRIDLHGVSVFGPGDHHQAIRWEWIDSISVSGGVVVTGKGAEILLPAGAFGLDPDALAECLREAGDIVTRTEVIGRLGGAVALDDG